MLRPRAITVVYYLVDYRRSGVLYRKKLPWMLIGGAGGLLAVGAVFIAVASGGF